MNAIAVLCAVLMSAWLISRLARDRNALTAMLISITIAGTIVDNDNVDRHILRQRACERRGQSQLSVEARYNDCYALVTP